MEKRFPILSARRIGQLPLLLAMAAWSAPDQGYPPVLEGGPAEVYKKIGDVTLKAHVFRPGDLDPEDRRPAVVFFFGGGWRAGSPAQFERHCRHLADQGLVAVAADYRVLSRHGTPARACVEDAKSAIRWVRENAERLGVDPERVAAAGGSAGGHLAACTATVPGFEAKGENLDISSVPNALVLFNPATVLAPVNGKSLIDPKKLGDLRQRMGVEPRELSPFHHMKKGLPPTLLFHGKADDTVPYRTAELFAEAMKKTGNRCDLVGFEDMPHGFFNHGRFGNRPYEKTLARLDDFLVSIGWIEMPTAASK